MKRILSMVIALSLVFALCQAAFAAPEKDALAEIVASVKTRLMLDTGAMKFTSQTYQNEENECLYNLDWYSEDGNSGINVSASDKGEILSFYKYNYNYESYNQTHVLKLPKESYRNIAGEFLKSVNPDLTKEFFCSSEGEVGNIYSENVTFTFNREHDGIKYEDNYANISVNKESGEVTSFNLMASKPAEYEPKEKAMSAEKAKECMKNFTKLTLAYIRVPDTDKAKLVYIPEMYETISAIDGKKFDPQIENGAAVGAKAEVAENEMSADNARGAAYEDELTEAELTEIEKVSSLISEDEIKAKIKQLTETDLPSYNVKSIRYSSSENEKKEKTYIAAATLASRDGKYSGSVSFNAESGELKSLYAWRSYDSSARKIYDSETMQKKADAFIGKWASDVENLKISTSENDASNGYFTYFRNVNGVPFPENSVYAELSPYTGKVVYYSRNCEETVTDFESTDGTISADEAYDLLCKNVPLKLSYQSQGMKAYGSKACKKAALVYAFSDFVPYIDAKSGKMLNWELSENLNTDKYEIQSDLKGHFAEAAVKTLAENGVILSQEESFRPNEILTQKEALLFVEKLMGRYTWMMAKDIAAEDISNACINSGIIDPDDVSPDRKVMREDAVCYLIRALGYRKAAEIPGIYRCIFSDEGSLAIARKGYVSIAYGLGIIHGSGNNKFEPKRCITRGEMAVLISNALSK